MNFTDYLQSKGMTPGVIARHEREVTKYETFLERYHTLKETANKKELLAYLKYLQKQRGLSNVTTNQILGMLKNYYAYASEFKELKNIASLIKIRGIRKKQLRPVFTDVQLGELCELYYNYLQSYKPNNRELYFFPDYDKMLKARFLALSFFTCQGLHFGEVLRLRRTDFDLRKGRVELQASKSAASRILPLDTVQIVSLLELFATGQDRIIDYPSHLHKINNQLTELTKGSELAFLDFRHLRASRIVAWIKTKGLRRAQYLAGHRHINATEKYKAHTYEELRKGLLDYHPLN
ncbi:site-specific integrase [Aquimarina sp. ERC-38]|uniref:tyrosine-type recombinase/integrase n=1 Tax=Aquimarina sp. ERC-38 TaxID=2949996 RepID=UPI002247B5EA|nr:hypothetical protein [Aquimarina sp. ERC-38]UZO80649.1 site-specific integrase [Aquimarina sp. ERC-38]UZO80663.1 site-specific integrase [Aquimarina sp. ERC-38]